MNILKKFFGEGAIRDRYGCICGHIVHDNDNVGRVYDMNSQCVAYIECYGREVNIIGSDNQIIEKGYYYDESDTVETMSYIADMISKKYTANGGISSVVSKGQVLSDRIYNSVDTCSSSENVWHSDCQDSNDNYVYHGSYGDDDYYDDLDYYYNNL